MVELKTCIKCTKEFDLSYFRKQRNGKPLNYCKYCQYKSNRNWVLNHKEKIGAYCKTYRQKYPDRVKASRIKYFSKNPSKAEEYEIRHQFNRRAKKFGLTPEEYKGLIIKQNNLCAICNSPQEGKRVNLAIDHDHLTGKVRALLCGACNTGLGLFKDNKELLTKAVGYLEVHSV